MCDFSANPHNHLPLSFHKNIISVFIDPAAYFPDKQKPQLRQKTGARKGTILSGVTIYSPPICYITRGLLSYKLKRSNRNII